MALGQLGLNPVLRRVGPRPLAVALLCGLSACAVRARGVVESREGVAHLRTVEGQALRLIAVGPASGIGSLDGAWVEVAGERVFGTLRVGWWTVTEGPHGFPAYVGVLQPLGAQLVIADRASGATLVLDRTTTAALWPERGRLAVIEGYIDGPHQLHATWSYVIPGDVPRQ